MKRVVSLLFFLVVLLLMPAVEGEESALIVCEHGQDMWDWNQEFIRQARHSIDISGNYFHGTVARRVLKEIEARLQVIPDLQVRLLFTPMTAEPEDLQLVAQLCAAYPDRFHCEYTVMVAMITSDVKAIDLHVKCCVVDSYYFSIGGSNLTDYECVDGSYTPPHVAHRHNAIASRLAAGYRDQNIVGRGPVAAEIHRQFSALFALWHHYNHTHVLDTNLAHFLDDEVTPIRDTPFAATFENSPRLIFVESAQIRLVLGGPHQKHNAISQEYIRLIRGAHQEICIANFFFYPTEAIFEAILDAINRGISVTVITNGMGEGAPRQNAYCVWANRLSYTPLFYGRHYHVWDYFSVKGTSPKANVHVYEYGVADVTLHKKTMLIDDQTLIIGSYNLGTKSHTSDYETVLIVDSEPVAREVKKIFLKDKQLSWSISYKEAINWYFNPSISYMGAMQRRFIDFI